MTISKQDRNEIRRTVEELDRLEAQTEVANQRLLVLVSRAQGPPVPGPFPPVPEALAKLQAVMKASQARRGKTPDPTSLTQRVLVEITRSPSPVAISGLATVLQSTPKQVRNAIVYFQKRGIVVHAGLPEHFVLKSRLNGTAPEPSKEQQP